MVKGTSRQVIVVHSPEQQLFEQAIFILKEDAVRQGVTDQQLLEEARKAIRDSAQGRERHLLGPVWAAAGALLTGAIWILSVL